jgi:broad specificity phosphatase PhoE
MVHLYLIRHGTTEDIEKRLMQGSSDSPLSARGREEAQRTAEALRTIQFSDAFSSPMGRALETARILTSFHPGLKVIQVDELHEMDFGYYERKVYFASPEEVPHGIRRLSLLAKIMLAQVTGETLVHVGRRASRSWEKISAIANGNEILIVSHGVLLNYLLKFLLPEAAFKAIKPVSLRPCSITELEVNSTGNARIIRINDKTHLK